MTTPGASGSFSLLGCGNMANWLCFSATCPWFAVRQEKGRDLLPGRLRVLTECSEATEGRGNSTDPTRACPGCCCATMERQTCAERLEPSVLMLMISMRPRMLIQVLQARKLDCAMSCCCKKGRASADWPTGCQLLDLGRTNQSAGAALVCLRRSCSPKQFRQFNIIVDVDFTAGDGTAN